ncbi:hypothetical protein JP0178_14460 [Helicobacter pylori]
MLQEKKMKITWNKKTHAKCKEWALLHSEALQYYYKSICKDDCPFSFRGASLFFDTEEVALVRHGIGEYAKKWDNLELAKQESELPNR